MQPLGQLEMGRFLYDTVCHVNLEKLGNTRRSSDVMIRKLPLELYVHQLQVVKGLRHPIKMAVM